MLNSSPKNRICEDGPWGLDIELRKKFQSMGFRDFYELIAKVTKYEELLREENHQRKMIMGTQRKIKNFYLSNIRLSNLTLLLITTFLAKHFH